MIYLDNAATSFPKPEAVYAEMDRCLRQYCANPGRGGHELSILSAKAVLKAREELCGLFCIDNPMELCFTKNATEALNIAIKGYVTPGSHVITTSMEHNSVVRPLKTLERDGVAEISFIEGDGYGRVDPGDFRKCIKSNTRLIVCTLSSNVNGTIIPVKEIGLIAKEYGIAFLVDASQGAGTIKIDVDEMNIDMLAFPGHKCLLGPQGTGGLYARSGIKLGSLMQGGTGSLSEYLYQPEMLPDRLESGTLNTPGIVGLSRGVEFIRERGVNNIREHIHRLTLRLLEGAREIRGLKIYSLDGMQENSGIAAVNFDGTDSTDTAYELDKLYGICVRPGIHCSPLGHKTLGTVETGLIRFSPGCFNTIDDIDFTLDCLRKISLKINAKI